jgi:hypothetical protein
MEKIWWWGGGGAEVFLFVKFPGFVRSSFGQTRLREGEAVGSEEGRVLGSGFY